MIQDDSNSPNQGRAGTIHHPFTGIDASKRLCLLFVDVTSVDTTYRLNAYWRRPEDRAQLPPRFRQLSLTIPKQRAEAVMARRPTGPRLIDGKYWAVRTVRGKKLSRCLGSDKTQAQRDWPQAWASLGNSRRLYDPTEMLWITEADGTTTPMRAMDVLSPRELLYDPYEAQEEPVREAWDKAIRVAKERQQRRTRKPYSKSWEAIVKRVLGYVPTDHKPSDLTPQLCRGMMDRMQVDGLGDVSIATLMAALSGLYTSLIKSGIEPDLDNPLLKVDYRAAADNHHYTAEEDDYRLIHSQMKDDPIWLLISYLGLRIQEAIHCQVVDDTVVIAAHDGWAPKNKASARTLPLPSNEQVKFTIINGSRSSIYSFRRRFNAARGERTHLTPHSFRHGLVRVSRLQGCDPLTMERVLGHSLASASQMLDVYGNGYPLPAMKRELDKASSLIDEWVMEEEG